MPDGNAIIPVVNKLLSLPFAVKVATQDWHPSNHVSFASSHAPPNNKPFESYSTVPNPENPTETERIRLWPDHCVADSHGAALVSGLDAPRLTHTVQKGQDYRIEMYSAFRDMYKSPCVAKSALEETLVNAGVSTVYCVGLAGDYCVKSTALHARESGFATAIVEDGIRCIDQSADGQAKLKQEFAAAGIDVVLSDELMK